MPRDRLAAARPHLSRRRTRKNGARRKMRTRMAHQRAGPAARGTARRGGASAPCTCTRSTRRRWRQRWGITPSRSRSQHTLCRDAQNAADKKREDKLNDDIREGLFRSATHNARTLLYPKLQQQGVCMLRDPATRKVTTKPADIATLATEYTRNLLCTPLPEPPTGRECQNPEQWNASER